MPAILPLAGTAWMPSTAGAILLLEGQRASFAEMDNWLTHFRLLGLFDGIAALVIGAPADWEVGTVADRDVDELVLRCVGGDFPVITNVPYGHQDRRIQSRSAAAWSSIREPTRRCCATSRTSLTDGRATPPCTEGPRGC